MTPRERVLFIKGLEAARRMVGQYATSFSWNPATERHDRVYTVDIPALNSALTQRIRAERKKARKG